MKINNSLDNMLLQILPAILLFQICSALPYGYYYQPPAALVHSYYYNYLPSTTQSGINITIAIF